MEVMKFAVLQKTELGKNTWHIPYMSLVFLSTDKNPETNTYVSVGDIHLELVVDRIREGRRNVKNTPYEIILASMN